MTSSRSSCDALLRPVAGGVRLAVRLTPRAREDRLRGIVTDADGRLVLAVSVRAVPEKGRANAALVALIARGLAVPSSRVRLCSGTASRRKTIEIAGEAAVLARRLARALPEEGQRGREKA